MKETARYPFNLYNCDYKKNKECPKTNCAYLHSNGTCRCTTNYKYAKKMLLRFINKIRGAYKYD